MIYQLNIAIFHGYIILKYQGLRGIQKLFWGDIAKRNEQLGGYSDQSSRMFLPWAGPSPKFSVGHDDCIENESELYVCPELICII